MFYTSGKEMGAPTGNWLYDSVRELTEMASMQFAVYGLMNPYTYQRPKITPLPNETGLTVPGGAGVAVVPNGTASALKQPYLPGQYTEYPAAVQGWAQQALPGGGSGIETSYGKSSEKLNWDAIVSKKGETRVEHIKRHTVQNNSRETHSVFNGNPIDMVNDAWEQRHLVEPISDGMGGTIYNIPYKNAGYESGYINTGAQMDYITIVTLDESTDLITAFPSFGDYHK